MSLTEIYVGEDGIVKYYNMQTGEGTMSGDPHEDEYAEYRFVQMNDIGQVDDETIRQAEEYRAELREIDKILASTHDPSPEVLMFLGRFSTTGDGTGTRWEVVEAFTQGGCYWLAFILKSRFEHEFGAEIMVDYVANHFGCRIGGKVYDITGDATERYNWEPWSECKNEALRRRIIDGCIMF